MKDIYVKSGYHLVQWNKTHDNYSCIYNGDKVVLRTKDKVFQGEIIDIGRKYTYILIQPEYRCKHILYRPNAKIAIDDIKSIRKFPVGSQRLGLIECNTNYRHSI